MQRHIIHRHIRRSTIVIGVVIVLLVVAYFLLEYRTAKIVELLVEEQSKGQFHLKLDDLDISVRKCKVELTNATFQQIGSSSNAVKSTVTIPKLYLQLASWSSLIFHKKLLIDSLLLVSPSFETIVDTNAASNQITFQTARIFEVLQQTVELLNIRSFQLQSGSILLHLYDAALPFEIHGINFSIRNFSPNSTKSNRFLSADEIEVSIPSQDWKLDEDHEIKFKHLQFSGRKQRFELDSLDFISYGENQQSEFQITADQISFKSDSLSAFYEKDELILDTLLSTHPVLWVQANADQSDTAASIGESLKKVFSNIRVRHFEIDDGQFEIEKIQEGKTSGYATQKTDIKIDDLALRPRESPFLTMGNIDMQLKELAFYTPDSLYQLTLEEFDLYNHEIHFRNAFFRPTSANPEAASFLVAIPILALHRLNFEDLLEGRLGADVAEMQSPVISITSFHQQKTNEAANGNMAGFYDALHGLNQLLRVKTLNVTHASVTYSSNEDSLLAELHDFNTSVSLNSFLNSHSLSDIKHSIPFFDVQKVDVKSKTLNATLENFHLHGTSQHNGIKNIQLQLSNGTTLEAKHFRWHHLDWDSLSEKHEVIADSVTLENLSINRTQFASGEQHTEHDLPVVRIGKVAVDKFSVDYPVSKEGMISAKGKNLLLSDFSSSKNIFLWTDVESDFTSVKYKSSNLTASVNKMHLETPGETQVIGIRADATNPSSTLHASIPEMKLRSDIASSDFSHLDLKSLTLNEPQINFTQSSVDSSVSKPFSIPINVALAVLRINGGQFNFNLKKRNDSIEISSSVDMVATSLSAGNDSSEILHAGKMDATLTNFSLSGKKINAECPSFRFRINDASVSNTTGGLAIQSSLSANWTDAATSIKFGKGKQLDVTNFSAALAPTSFNLKPGEKIQWKNWLSQVSVSQAKTSFNDSLISVSAAAISWNPAIGELRIDSFKLQPKDSAQEYLNKRPWQSDYISLNGSSVTLSGIDVDQWRKDSLLKVHKMDFQNFYVDVFRDKRIPFQHGVEKPMPTQLIHSITTHFNVDSVTLQNSNIYYHEFSNITNREGTVPIENINAVMKKFGNDHGGNTDTLSIKGTAQLLSAYLSKFHYKEVYNDSLSSFKLTVKAWPIQLTDFSKITNPLAAIEVNSGKCDTLIARASGNKYASIGQMQFYYRDLKVNLLDRQDTMNKRLSLSFVNFVANKFVIRPNNRRDSKIFFVRDQERFVFNYWSKMILSGVLSSAGIKSNRKYSKQYHKMKDEYNLPQAGF
ncbi:MAG: hypothetical protein ACHQD9_00170 [Chitinophagales bacterium]